MALPVPTKPTVDALLAPFTAIYWAYDGTFELIIKKMMTDMAAVLTPMLLAVATIWIIIQGMLVMRGDIDTRRGVFQVVKLALVVGFVSSTTIYSDYVEDMFFEGIPGLIKSMGGVGGAPLESIPTLLDGIFRIGQAGFLAVGSRLPSGDQDMMNAMSFDCAQFFFYFSLWSIFGMFHVMMIMIKVLVAVGPLFIIGFLFEATAGMAARWVGQLVSYGITLILTSIVVSAVVVAMGLGMAAVFAPMLLPNAKHGAAQLIGLYELDLFIMSGNALVVAVPAIAASIGGGVGTQGSQIGQSIYRAWSKKRPASAQTQQLASFIQ